jgi:hypothetical protein
MHQQPERPRFRFARDVGLYAPKRGQHLVTASFQVGDEACVAYGMEGPWTNTVSFRGMATNFERTRLWRRRLTGSIIEQLKEIHHTPQAPQLVARLEALDSNISPLDVREVKVLFSSVRAPNEIDADAAIVRFEMMNGEKTSAWLTNHSRGWLWSLVLIVVTFLLRFSVDAPEEGTALNRAVEFDVPGGFTPLRISGLLQCFSGIMPEAPLPPAGPTISSGPEEQN